MSIVSLPSVLTRTARQFVDRAGSARGLSWPLLFGLGMMAGGLLGLATGLPVASGVAAPVIEDPVGGLRLAPRSMTASGVVSGIASGPQIDDRPVATASDVALTALAPVGPGNDTNAPVAPMADASPDPTAVLPGPSRPKIAVVIDDLGLNWAGFDQVNALPPPVTLSFLPYGVDAQLMVNEMAAGHEAMLHLPMEPMYRIEDAGPDMLRAQSDAKTIRTALGRNLAKLDGYKGVNNHTGSRFTANPAAMAVVLRELHARGLYFLDSVTTHRPVAKALAEQEPWRVIERDVFLDSDYKNISTQSVATQLAQAERIAKRDGEAIVIGHPYRVTLESLASWLPTARARGFDVVPLSVLVPQAPAPVLAGLR